MIIEGIEVRIIPTFLYHYVSDSGLVWNEPRVVRCGRGEGNRIVGGRWLKPEDFGRFRYILQEHGKIRKEFAHRLVALAWIGPPPFPNAFVLHGDDDPYNNHVSNLRWGTQVDNMEDRYKNGKYFVQAISSLEHLKAIYLATKMQTTSEVAKAFGLGYDVVFGIKSKLYWSKLTDQMDSP